MILCLSNVLIYEHILHKNKYPMVNTPNSIKNEYYTALEKAQVEGNLKPFVDLLCTLMQKEKIRF